MHRAGPNRQRSQDFVPVHLQWRDRVQGHALLFPDAPLSLSQSLRTDRTKERLLSPLLQHARPLRLRGTSTQQRVLRPQRHVSRTRQRI